MYNSIQEIHIPNVFGSEKIVMKKVALLASEIGFSDDRIEDLKTAVSEACLNAIEHGNKMKTGTKVAVSLSTDKTKMKVSIEDRGKGVNGTVNEPNIDDKIKGTDKSTRGWGLFLIKRLVDEVQFEPKGDGSNMTTMIIHLGEEGSNKKSPGGN